MIFIYDNDSFCGLPQIDDLSYLGGYLLYRGRLVKVGDIPNRYLDSKEECSVFSNFWFASQKMGW